MIDLHTIGAGGSFTEIQSVGGVNVTVDRSHEPLPQLPHTQFSLGATQTVPTAAPPTPRTPAGTR